MEDRIKELEKENEILRSITESVGAFEKDMHDKSLQVAREIRRRDRKAAANIILNMGFGNRNNVSFCEIFELKENGGCEKHKYCTDCIDAYLKSVYLEETGGQQDRNVCEMCEAYMEDAECDMKEECPEAGIVKRLKEAEETIKAKEKIIKERDKTIRELKKNLSDSELKRSYMIDPMAIGDRHEMGG